MLLHGDRLFLDFHLLDDSRRSVGHLQKMPAIRAVLVEVIPKVVDLFVAKRGAFVASVPWLASLLAFLPRPFFGCFCGGLTISDEGGFEELPECFVALAVSLPTPPSLPPTQLPSPTASCSFDNLVHRIPPSWRQPNSSNKIHHINQSPLNGYADCWCIWLVPRFG